MLSWIIICLSLSLIAQSAPVDCSINNDAYIYINPQGNDTTNNGNFSSPFKTLTKAFEKVSATNNVVCVQQGTYTAETTASSPKGKATVVGVNNPTFEQLVIAMGKNDSLEFFDLDIRNLQTQNTGESVLLSNLVLKNVYVSASSVSLQSSQVNSGAGDMLYLHTLSSCIVNETSVTGIQGTTNDVGAVVIYGRNVQVLNSAFNGNSAGVSGALFINATANDLSVILDKVNFTNNRALGNNYRLGLTSAVFVYKPSHTTVNVTLNDITATCHEQSLIGFNTENVNFNYTVTTPWTNCTSSCNPGQYHSQDFLACMLCPAGEFSNETNARNCDTCPAGSVSSPGDTECSLCVAGSYANVTLQECLLCPPGTYSNSKTVGNECTLCQKGEFNPESGQTSCSKCSDGQYTDQPGAYECQGLSYLSWALIAVGVVVFLLIIGFWIGYRIFTNRKHAYQAIE